MAEKTRDAEDQLLTSMFHVEPIDDAGFSDRIVGRIRRGIWLRRLTLPVAILLGAAVAGKPLLQLAKVAAAVGDSIPGFSLAIPESMLTQLPGVFTVGCLMLIGIIMFKLSEE